MLPSFEPCPILKTLPPAQLRRFVPVEADLSDWQQIESLFIKLKTSVVELKTPEALERWTLDASELGAALEQEGAIRYIAMTCRTDDPEAEKAFLYFVENIEPRAKPCWHKLKKAFIENLCHKKLPKRRWMVFTRGIRNDVELFRQENVSLQVEETKLEQQYQKIIGAMTVVFQNKEQTLQQMSRYLEEPERETRRQAWETIAERYRREADKLDQLYDDLLKLRGQIAANAQLSSYREYAFKMRGRFDYTPKDCETFHQAIEELVVPLARNLQTRRQRLLNVSELRPWDLSVDVKNRPPLKPFASVAQLVEKCHGIFQKLDPTLALNYDLLRRHELLDLESRKGKAPGGYQCSLEEARLPFIFMNAVGLHRDVETMLHEAGHAFHALAARDEPLVNYRAAPLEFCEVASMSMELLAAPYLTEFYSPTDAARARRKHLEGIIGLLPWIATIDAFQHWIYTHARHSRDERRAQWLALLERFGGMESYAGFEDTHERLWQRQSHLFVSPFYYIEYGIAQLGALQMWLNAKKNSARALADYQAALKLGGSRPLPELFRAARLRFDFSAKTIKPLISAIKYELDELEDA